uniref:PEGA domain-containing protein n=1 Tax=Candidatus Methanophagaceae archaeon ANME-1 ERB6 TaxID=2759912 RepID=A0A7G9YWL3_9EURY|nr:hypothetical protein IAKEDICC_00018 [Methanosarcinales archaeon ANME-1 ERB6]
MKKVANMMGIIGLVFLLVCVCVLYPAAGQIGEIGSISVTSSPSGADISLNGEPINAVTPYTIQHLDPAYTYTIKLSLEGYQDWVQKNVNVVSQQTTYVSATLTPIPPPPVCTPYATKCIGNNLYRCSYDGSRWDFMESCEYGCSGGACNSVPPRGYISVSSSPSGANIYLDDAYHGTTPRTIAAVAPGHYTVSLDLPGYQRYETGVDVSAGGTSSVSASLVLSPTPSPTSGTISVSSSPSGAYIYLDNTYKGIAPLTITDVSPGTHAIKATLAGYEDWSTNTEVTSGSTASVSASLTQTSTPTPTPTPKAPTTVLGVIAALAISGIIAAKVRRGGKYKKK